MAMIFLRECRFLVGSIAGEQTGLPRTGNYSDNPGTPYRGIAVESGIGEQNLGMNLKLLELR
jgi:hypothetical protein